MKPGIGVVATNFSGSFSWAFAVNEHKTSIIMIEVFSDRRNLFSLKIC